MIRPDANAQGGIALMGSDPFELITEEQQECEAVSAHRSRLPPVAPGDPSVAVIAHSTHPEPAPVGLRGYFSPK